jgi:hypothetical protein
MVRTCLSRTSQGATRIQPPVQSRGRHQANIFRLLVLCRSAQQACQAAKKLVGAKKWMPAVDVLQKSLEGLSTGMETGMIAMPGEVIGPTHAQHTTALCTYAFALPLGCGRHLWAVCGLGWLGVHR